MKEWSRFHKYSVGAPIPRCIFLKKGMIYSRRGQALLQLELIKGVTGLITYILLLLLLSVICRSGSAPGF